MAIRLTLPVLVTRDLLSKVLDEHKVGVAVTNGSAPERSIVVARVSVRS
jgi:hypothetical protein